MIGLLLCEELPDDVRDALLGIQHDLFDLGGEMSIPGAKLLKDSQPARLEEARRRCNADLRPLKEFILPGGTRAAALDHLARTVCRRAERAVVALAHNEAVSDAARGNTSIVSPTCCSSSAAGSTRPAGCGDVLWQKGKNAA